MVGCMETYTPMTTTGGPSKAAWLLAAADEVGYGWFPPKKDGKRQWRKWFYANYVWLCLVLELWAWLLAFGWAAWFTTPAVPALYVFIRAAVGLHHMGCDPGELWTAGPVAAVFPVRCSAFGLRQQQGPTRGFHIWHVVLVALLLALFLFVMGRNPSGVPHVQCRDGIHIQMHPHINGNATPAWIQCEISNTSYSWKECISDAAWWERGTCGAYPAMQFQFESGNTFGFFTMMYAPAVAAALRGVLAVLRCICCCGHDTDLAVRKIVREEAQKLDVKAKNAEMTSSWLPMWIVFEVGFYIADFTILDGLAAYNYFHTCNYWFAGAQSLVYLIGVVEFFTKGGFCKMYEEAQASMKRGLRTDEYLEITQREQTVEAVFSVSMTYYAFAFVSFDTFATYTCLLSLISGTRAVITGAMQTIHLSGGDDMNADSSDSTGSCSDSESADTDDS